VSHHIFMRISEFSTSISCNDRVSSFIKRADRATISDAVADPRSIRACSRAQAAIVAMHKCVIVRNIIQIRNRRKNQYKIPFAIYAIHDRESTMYLLASVIVTHEELETRRIPPRFSLPRNPSNETRYFNSAPSRRPSSRCSYRSNLPEQIFRPIRCLDKRIHESHVGTRVFLDERSLMDTPTSTAR